MKEENIQVTQGEIVNLIKSKKFIFLLAICLSSFILLTLTFIFDTRNVINRSNSSTKDSKENFALSLTTPGPSRYEYAIFRKSGNNNLFVYGFDKSTFRYIVRWKNYIFYSYYIEHIDQKSGEILSNVYAHNINTGETKIIFRQRNKKTSTIYLDVIDDTLFFSMGAYIVKGQIYWVDLNSNFLPHKLNYDDSGTISKINNNYFITHGWGDSCAGTMDYNLINIKTKVIKPVIKTAYGCSVGDEDLGINSKNEMYLAQHGDNKKGIPAGMYLNVFKIPLTNPTDKTYVISSEEMPKDINIVKYSEQEKKIILIGEAIYVFDIEANSLRKIVNLPAELKNDNPLSFYNRPILTAWNTNIVCMEKTSEQSQSAYKVLIDLNTAKTSLDTSLCPPEKKTQDYFSEPPEKVFKNLKLPQNYVLIYNG